jgi:hypothetical protein
LSGHCTKAWNMAYVAFANDNSQPTVFLIRATGLNYVKYVDLDSAGKRLRIQEAKSQLFSLKGCRLGSTSCRFKKKYSILYCKNYNFIR